MGLIAKEEVYESVLSLLTKDAEGDKERLLNEIVQWEEQHPPVTEYSGFEWYHVHSDARTLITLVTRRILDVLYKTNSATVFRTIDREAISKALHDYSGTLIEKEDTKEIPPDLFNIVIGHEDKKEVILRAITSPKPVHCLLFGTPASAKTLMLEELSKLPNSHFVLGSSLTKAGLFELLFQERPTYLILDELDKIDDSQNLAALLSLMHKGVLTETKHRRHNKIFLNTWVFASANEISKIPRELMSRFFKLKFNDYTNNEYAEVVVNVLREQEGLTDPLALYIGQRVMRELESKDVRDAIRVARLLKVKDKNEIDHIIDIMKVQK